MILPKYIIDIIETLETQGFEAYVVGGCVRDSLLGRPISDYDMTTNATPEQVKEIFKSFQTIDVGIEHGTVIVMYNGNPIEITTFRIDGKYVNNRKPEDVTFTSNLNDDLCRRDFTVNAIAYNPKLGIIDPFGGQNDVQNKIIRCVGDPWKRFNEDALRILRGLRFAATFGFQVEPKTEHAIHNCAPLLQNISEERKNAELSKILLGKNVKYVLLENHDVLSQMIPEIKPLKNFNMHSLMHSDDAWTHTVKSISYAPFDLQIRLSLLLHELGKPLTVKCNDGTYTFPNHCEIGSVVAANALERLKFDRETINTVLTVLKHHEDFIICERPAVKKAMNSIGVPMLRKLLVFQKANMSAQTNLFSKRISRLNNIEDMIDEIVAAGECYNRSMLAIRGSDLMEIGVVGLRIGHILGKLLDEVIEEKCPNEKKALLELAGSIRNMKIEE